MITSLIVGSLSKVVSSFLEHRKEKKAVELEEHKKNSEIQRQIELMSAQKEYDLKIEEQKTEQKELELLKEQIEKQKIFIQEIHQTDRKLFDKLPSFLITWIGSMKPLIGTIAAISYFLLLRKIALNEISPEMLEILTKYGFIGTCNDIIGFWFGFESMAIGTKLTTKKQ